MLLWNRFFLLIEQGHDVSVKAHLHLLMISILICEHRLRMSGTELKMFDERKIAVHQRSSKQTRSKWNKSLTNSKQLVDRGHIVYFAKLQPVVIFSLPFWHRKVSLLFSRVRTE